MKTMTQAEFVAECTRRFGPDPINWKVVCPKCGTIQCGLDFKEAGLTAEQANRYIAFSCIGRYTTAKGCDWTLGGLLHIHKLEVVMNDGHIRPTFDIAEVRA